MKLNPVRMGRRPITSVLSLIVLMLTLPALTQRASAQAHPADMGPYQIFHLTNVTEMHDALDLMTDLRNMLPMARLYYVESQNAISVRGSAEDIEAAQKMLADLDRPHKIYRLTYSLTEMDGDKSLGTQKVSFVVPDSGEKTTLKQGSKLPIVTGVSDTNSSGQNSQVQYIDIGLAIEASVNSSGAGLHLHTKVEQSSVEDAQAGAHVPDPTIRQTVIEGTTALTPGTPLILGSLDMHGSTHREEVSVVSELVH
jgi:type II secretory pathway component GspD/PulD (secretin)